MYLKRCLHHNIILRLIVIWNKNQPVHLPHVQLLLPRLPLMQSPLYMDRRFQVTPPSFLLTVEFLHHNSPQCPFVTIILHNKWPLKNSLNFRVLAIQKQDLQSQVRASLCEIDANQFSCLFFKPLIARSIRSGCNKCQWKFFEYCNWACRGRSREAMVK